jgi:magnesium chelatase family protein
MLVKSFGSAVFGINASTITIEVHSTQGAMVCMVGLPDAAVRESQQRIRAAIIQSGYKALIRNMTINLAPADIRKEGAAYDLPVAVAMLASTEQVSPKKLLNYVMMGELALDGGLRPICGALSMALQAKKEGFLGIIVPTENAAEAALVEGLIVIPATHLKEVVDFLDDKIQIEPKDNSNFNNSASFSSTVLLDFNEVKGQENVKRAFLIAAAGGHNIILVGPPGAGKTMLAKRLPGILPPLSLDEALETTKIHSVSGKVKQKGGVIRQRPFRSPHHSLSDIALVGGGSIPQPGEISLAHNGVLFLDELPEFKRGALEVLRQPLEDRTVTITRSRFSVDFPANFILVASMNPCPCGYFNHPTKDCSCPPGAVQKYLNKISGPLLDRIDLHIEVTPVAFDELAQLKKTESSVEMMKKVVSCRETQKKRSGNLNSELSSVQLSAHAQLNVASNKILKLAMEKLQLSARSYDRIIRVARTIADLENSNHIEPQHISEAILYRSLDRENWAG